MPTIKETKVKITSTIENLTPGGALDGDPEVTEVICEGFLKNSENELVISYAEFGEGGKVVSDIIIKENSVRALRRGAIISDMYFCEGVSDKSLYRISEYSFDTEIFTRKIRNNMTCDGGKIDIFYDMKIGGADKSVRMKIECLK